MATEIGTSTNAADLYGDLITFLTARDQTTAEDHLSDSGDVDYLIIRNLEFVEALIFTE